MSNMAWVAYLIFVPFCFLYHSISSSFRNFSGTQTTEVKAKATDYVSECCVHAISDS